VSVDRGASIAGGSALPLSPSDQASVSMVLHPLLALCASCGFIHAALVLYSHACRSLPQPVPQVRPPFGISDLCPLRYPVPPLLGETSPSVSQTLPS
jgi:hypothetical protein